MTDTTPIEPLVEGTRKAAIHFAKSAFEFVTGVGALVTAVTRTVRPRTDEDPDDHRPQRVPVE